MRAVERAVRASNAAASAPSAIRNQPLAFHVFDNADAAHFGAIVERIKSTPGMYYTSQHSPADAALLGKWAERVSVQRWQERKGTEAEKAASLAQYIKECLTSGRPSVNNPPGGGEGVAQKVLLDELSGGNARFVAEVARHIGPKYAGQWGMFVQRRPLAQKMTLRQPGHIKEGLDALFKSGAILVMETYPQNRRGTSTVTKDGRLKSSNDPVAKTYQNILARNGLAKADAYLAAKLQPYADLVAYQKAHHPNSASPVRLVIDVRSDNNRQFLDRLFHVATTHPSLAPAFRGVGPSVFKWDAAPSGDGNPTATGRDESYVQLLNQRHG